MRRFLALSLSFFILITSLSNFVSADSTVTVTPGIAKNLIKTEIYNFDSKIIGKNEDICALRLIKVSTKKPDEFFQTKAELENPGVFWGVLTDMLNSLNFSTLKNTFFAGVLGAILGGVSYFFSSDNYSSEFSGQFSFSPFVFKGLYAGLITYWIPKIFNFWKKNMKINDFNVDVNNTPLDVVLVPVNKQAAKILQKKHVSAGDMKEEEKEKQDKLENIKKNYKIGENAEQKNTDGKLLLYGENCIDGIYQGARLARQRRENQQQGAGIDPYDPFNASSKSKAALRPENLINPSAYYSQDEANKTNDNIDKKKSEVVSKVKEAIDSEQIKVLDYLNFTENSNFILDKEKPDQYFLEAVINDTQKTDAFKFLALYTDNFDQFSLNESHFNFGAKINLVIKDARYKEVLESLRDTWGTKFFKGITPPWLYNIVDSLWNDTKLLLWAPLKNKASAKISTVSNSLKSKVSGGSKLLKNKALNGFNAVWSKIKRLV